MPTDRARPGGAMGDPHRSHGGRKKTWWEEKVMKMASTKSRRKGDGKSRGVPMAGARRLEGVKGHGGGRTPINIEDSCLEKHARRFCRFFLKTGSGVGGCVVPSQSLLGDEAEW